MESYTLRLNKDIELVCRFYDILWLELDRSIKRISLEFDELGNLSFRQYGFPEDEGGVDIVAGLDYIHVWLYGNPYSAIYRNVKHEFDLLKKQSENKAVES